MLYTTNEDVPGIIGLLGMTMGKNNVNIANFTLGRSGVGKDAIAILYLDQAIDPKVVETLETPACSSRSRSCLQFEIHVADLVASPRSLTLKSALPAPCRMPIPPPV
jgi:D-3-phosphoglycerate dehydrogenase